MIYVYLTGGLGNQMFQYAAARALAEKAQSKVCLDLLFLNSKQDGVTKRKFELDALNINAEYASKSESDYIRRSGSRYLKYLNIFHSQKISIIKETGFGYSPIVHKPNEDICLMGYWQSEKYFAGIKEIISKELSPKKEAHGKNKVMAEEISKVNSVSLHIRRGDYVSNPLTNSVHGVCGVDFYLNSIKYINEKVDMPHYFVFSDAMDWCRKNLNPNAPVTFVDHNLEDNSYEDMRLMTLCKHNIIANSSFSWWGAWLNRNPEKIIIAPRKWFNDNSKNTNDLLPEGWLRI
jgi:hypothetical protein